VNGHARSADRAYGLGWLAGWNLVCEVQRLKTFTAGPHIDSLNRRLPRLVAAPLKGLIKGYRELTAGFRTLPDFLVIGSRKCGTTSLYQYLTEHPCVLPAMSKEIFYFGEQFHRGERWYRRHFPLGLEHRLWSRWRGCRVLTGEATPNYFNNALAPHRVRAMNPAVKLIVMLRDPVAAVYSAYNFGIARGTYTAEQHSFRNLVEQELHQLRDDPAGGDCQTMLLPRYVYANHLVRWLDVFPTEQLRVMCLEWFKAAPQEQFDGLTDFLGLSRSQSVSFEPHNVTAYPAMDVDLRGRLRAFYEPHNERLGALCGRAFPWPKASDNLQPHDDREEFDASDSGEYELTTA
jgi:Sulfotransferase domain